MIVVVCLNVDKFPYVSNQRLYRLKILPVNQRLASKANNKAVLN